MVNNASTSKDTMTSLSELGTVNLETKRTSDGKKIESSHQTVLRAMVYQSAAFSVVVFIRGQGAAG